jgi:predicted O-methyltransferase YrrM
VKNEFFRIGQFVKYLVKAKGKYYLHSPFVYHFFLNVLERKDNDEKLNTILNSRLILQNNKNEIAVEDLGTGKSVNKKISVIEKNVAVRHKYGKLLYHLVCYTKPKTILELGTSVGISTAYIASANSLLKLITIEGSVNLIELAKQNHEQLGLSNICYEAGNFDKVLPSVLKNNGTFDFIFFDGNHTQAATLKYFYTCIEYATENSVFVFDDIYWSSEMRDAWIKIKSEPRVTLTVDLFQFGICFFKKDKLAKENFVLRY